MIFEFDKKKHYKYCYDHTMLVPNPFRPIWGLGVFVCVSIYKEIIHDLILRKGNCDIFDVFANFIGCYDAIFGKGSKF